MSAFLLGLGFKADMGTPQRKLVLLKLIDACEDDGTRIYPAVATLARAAQCSARQVQRELAAFVDLALIRLVRAGGRGPGSTNEYALDLEALREIAEKGWAAFAEGRLGPRDKPEGDEGEGAAAEPAQPDSTQAAEEAAAQRPAGAAGSEATGAPREAKKGDPQSPFSDSKKGDSGDAKGDRDDAKGDSWSRTTPPLDPSIDPSTSARQAREVGVGDRSEPKNGEGEEPLGVLDAAQRKALLLAWTHFDGQAGGTESWIVREAVKLSAGELARACDPARIDAYRRVEKRERLARLKLFYAWLHGRKFDAPAVAEEMARAAAPPPPMLAPFGKGWFAARLERLEAQERAGRAAFRPNGFQQRMIETGKARLVEADRLRAEFPAVARMDAAAAEGRGVEAGERETAGFVTAARGDALWRAWEAFHARRDWPFIEPPAHVRFVWLPAAVPAEGAAAPQSQNSYQEAKGT